MSAPASPSQSVQIRRAQPADAEICGRICYDAFEALQRHHNLSPDFPDPSRAIQALTMMFSHPGFYCVVAESDGQIIGSNCLDERGPIAGVGPITVNPAVQNRSAGRQLMAAVMDRAKERGFAGVRLVQEAYHNRSLSLYTKLGFDAREPLSLINGTPIRRTPAGYRFRHAERRDVEACNALCIRVHGHDRGGDLRDSIEHGMARVVEFDGRIVAYASAIGFFGYSVAETNRDLQALIASAEEFLGPGVLVPTRNSALFRWCLNQGLRVIKPLTLMTVGLYNEPSGAYLCSILY
ncbi:MAG: GNAT family N-acetyltransferase [Candidatus Acidiferrales bacterium]